MFWFSEWDKLERDEQRTTLNVELDDSKINENTGQNDLKRIKKSFDLYVHSPSVFKTSPSCSG